MSHPTKFTLEITLEPEGNSYTFKRDVANYLAITSDKIKRWAIPCAADVGHMHLDNGTQIGEWKFHYE